MNSAAPNASVLNPSNQTWRVLVVDDEPGLHDVTRLVLKRLRFEDRSLEIVSCYSAEEARAYLNDHRDIAVAIIDVVMEHDKAGLELIKDIRERYDLDLTRVILRTGNPGSAPEREVIQYFQIDDYRDKTELTSDRLYTAVFTALRAYQTLLILEQTAGGLERIIKTPALSKREMSFYDFVTELIGQMQRVLHGSLDDHILSDAVAIRTEDNQLRAAYHFGAKQPAEERLLSEVLNRDKADEVAKLFNGKDQFLINEMGIFSRVHPPNGDAFLLWLPTRGTPPLHVARLVRVFIEKFQLGVDNARLQDEILDAQSEALGKLCEAVEMRSKETGQHIYRMAKYSRLIAELLGLPSHQVDLIEASAPLHDIGKVAIPDSVLKKAGPLDPDEMQVMRGHSVNGWELLHGTKSEMLQMGAEIALTHHERWDGTGYPRGLKGENIPLFGRIVSLADVFDALMSKRVYKEAFSFERTMAIIQEGSGTSFDPNLVKLMAEHGPEFRQIFINNPDQATPE